MVCSNIIIYYRGNFFLINKDSNNSIHLKKFVEIPQNWKNEILNEKWKKILIIRDKANISIEGKRAEKIIGSSLEANINIKLKNELYKVAKDFDFAEICITSNAKLISDNSLSEEIEVETTKAKGEKCKVCWKINVGKCERHG